jgi:hypothetical protein
VGGRRGRPAAAEAGRAKRARRSRGCCYPSFMGEHERGECERSEQEEEGAAAVIRLLWSRSKIKALLLSVSPRSKKKGLLLSVSRGLLVCGGSRQNHRAVGGRPPEPPLQPARSHMLSPPLLTAPLLSGTPPWPT